jgi:glycosyltransferase involved in cell wall biosynthesis
MISEDSYVLVSAAYNEGKYIENTILSVISQDVRPALWIIVSDGSTDETDAIVEKFAVLNEFIRLHRMTEDHPRNFAAQVHAINVGIGQIQKERFGFIGNLDADITIEPSYFRLLLGKFRQNPRLGLAGGAIYEKFSDGSFKYRRGNRVTSVAHAVQLFRRECFMALGGAYRPLPYGGPDAYAETEARMKGWNVESFPELKVFHHRPTGSSGGVLRYSFRQGRMDYSMGASPIFEVIKLLGRVGNKPYMAGALSRLTGFVYSYLRGEQRAVSKEFMEYLRQEQMRKLRGIYRPRWDR